ncbi:hypothetical protein CC79DRAFT_1336614 [Sarocladium strictum]
MAPPKPTLPKAATPKFGAHFDAWNSSSSGHQRPDNQPGTGWRESRNQKLSSQFRNGQSGGARLSDTWGAGSPDWDDKRKVVVPQALRERKTGQKSVADMLVQPGRMREVLAENGNEDEPAQRPGSDGLSNSISSDNDKAVKSEQTGEVANPMATQGQHQRRIFDGVVAYVNGSTFPLVSDHRLKQILSENGGNMSLHLGRRKVTHVILGRPAGGGSAAATAAARGGRGAGGGLAGGKIEKEIKRIGGCGVKFVSVEWYVLLLPSSTILRRLLFATCDTSPKVTRS